MHQLLQPLAHFFYQLGGLGLLLLGILDSSFLMMPLGNDLLLVALTAARHAHLFYYVAMATAGSTGGVALAHIVSSRTGRKAIEGKNKSRQVAYVEKKIEQYGGLAIGVAALAPPGFPFTPFIVVPAALQYPMGRMLAIIAVCRAIRFTIEGGLAVKYGSHILQLMKSSGLQTALLILVALSLIGSAFSIYGWIRKGKNSQA